MFLALPILFISAAFAAEPLAITGVKKHELTQILDQFEEAGGASGLNDETGFAPIAREDLPGLLKDCSYADSMVQSLIQTFYQGGSCLETVESALRSGFTVEEMRDVISDFYVMSNESGGKVYVW